MSTQQSNKPRIGLLGGSFNPVHIVHIRLALSARIQAHLQEVQLLPAAQPWQKDAIEVSTEDRINMLKLAINGHPELNLNLVEIERGGPTYTIDTLRELPDDADYFWIMGSDQLNNFCSWDHWQEILDYVQLVVAKRPDYQLQLPDALSQELSKRNSNIIEITFKEQDISSTQVRQQLQNQQSVADLLAPAVLDYINQHQLYTS